MRVVLQRVNSASVSVEERVVGAIQRGLLLFVGFGSGDTNEKLLPLAEKILNLRVFAEGEKKFHLSTLETKAQVLLVSQFTLYADLSKGRRPDFFASLEAEKAKTLFDAFVELFRKLSPGVVQTGSFGASMQVNLENDGPATFLFEA